MELIFEYQMDLGPSGPTVGLIHYVEDGQIHCSIFTAANRMDVAYWQSEETMEVTHG